ncbi:MAG: VOC family protein [Methylophilaceae bacterium]|nr:VOC family protein [Methyloradius sp.]
MAVSGFNHYNIRAPRPLLERLRDFYCEVVGLQLGERPALRSFGYWLYASGKDVLHLSEAKDGEVRLTDVQTTFDHVAFTCTDYAATEVLLAERGLEFTCRVIEATHVRQIFFRDPAGNGVEFNFVMDAR